MRLPVLWLFGIVAELVACSPRLPSGASKVRAVTLLYTADLHSHLLGEQIQVSARDAAHGLGVAGETTSVGGAARLGSVVAEVRASVPGALLLDAGDLLEGTSFFPTFGGEAEMRAFAALSVSAMAFGNHDLAQGADWFDALRRKWADFPLLAANLEPEGARGIVAPYAMLTAGDAQVLVVGLGLRPEGAPSVGAAAAAVDDAVEALGGQADLVVVLSHLGSERDRALVPLTTGVDLVVGGHTHDVIDPPALVVDCDAETARARACVPKPVPLVHPGAYGRYVGRADFVLSSDPSDLAAWSGLRPSAIVDERFSLLPVGAAVPEDAKMADLLAPYAATLHAAGDDAKVAFAPDALSRHAVSRGDSALGNLVTEAMRRAASADVALLNSTGIRADLLAGPVSAGDLVRVFPFSDELVTVTLSGEELSRALSSPARAACRAGDPSPFQVAGAAVTVTCEPFALDLRIGDVPAPPGIDLVVAAPSFLTDGRYLSPPSGAGLGRTGEPLRDAVVEVFRRLRSCPPAQAAGFDLPCLIAVADGHLRFR